MAELVVHLIGLLLGDLCETDTPRLVQHNTESLFNYSDDQLSSSKPSDSVVVWEPFLISYPLPSSSPHILLHSMLKLLVYCV